MTSPNSEFSLDRYADLTARFTADPTARVAQNAVSTTNADKLSLDRQVLTSIDTSVSDKVDTWKVSNQKQSGRCWLFSGLNLLRSHLINDLKLTPDFELSQNYLHFFDKLEKANWFLASMAEMSDRDIDDRTVHQMLSDPISDGGQWDMFVSLVNKYGVVPKYAMPETDSSSSTRVMNRRLEEILRRGALIVRGAADRGQADAARESILTQVHRVLSIHLGTPPASFLWQYRDKDNAFTRVGQLTPREFADTVVPINLDDFVCLVNDPRTSSGFNTMLTVDHLGNVVGGRPIRYLNVEIDVIKKITIDQILAGHPVWFGCDVLPQFDRDIGYWDLHLHDYEGLYGIDMDTTKADRMVSGASAMTHAMMFTGVDLLDDAPRRWRVENSWGDDHADKGFFTMNDSWFDQYVFEVAVPKASLDQSLRDTLATEPKVLPLWDPMGALA